MQRLFLAQERKTRGDKIKAQRARVSPNNTYIFSSNAKVRPANWKTNMKLRTRTSILFIISIILSISLYFIYYMETFTHNNSKDTKTIIQKVNTKDFSCPKSPSFSAMNVWQRNIKQIHKSSNNKRWNRKFDDFTNQVLNHITPDKLLKSVSTLPSSDAIERIVEKVRNRYKEQSIHPPIKILVFGGSVTQGSDAFKNPVFKTVKSLIEELGGNTTEDDVNHDSKWTTRLENLINDIAGFTLVDIKNIAQGGTISMKGTIMIDYGLVPVDMQHPDIIINSYSTNDMHLHAVSREEFINRTLHENIFDMLQNFIRAALCVNNNNHPPLVIILDDFVGSRRTINFPIMEVMAFNTVMKQLSGYYDIMSVSYADVVRNIALYDTEETWFSPNWISGKSNEKIHLPMAGHLGITWVLAFNFLYLIEIYCHQTNFNEYYSISSNTSTHYKGKPKLISINDDKPLQLPPKLSKKLTLQNVAKEWKHGSNNNNICSMNDIDKTCYFKWINGVDNSKKSFMNTTMLVENSKNKLSQIIKYNNGWNIIEDYNNKLGLVATGGKDSLVQLILKDVNKPINSLIFFILRSYGAKWKDSKVKIKVNRRLCDNPVDKDEEILFIELSGQHESSTSLIYPYAYKLDKEIDVGNTMLMNIQLVDGTNFKFTDMAFCYK